MRFQNRFEVLLVHIRSCKEGVFILAIFALGVDLLIGGAKFERSRVLILMFLTSVALLLTLDVVSFFAQEHPKNGQIQKVTETNRDILCYKHADGG